MRCGRSFTKRAPSSERLHSLGAEVFVGDLLDFHSIRPAFDGIGPAYFCYPLWPCAIEAAALLAGCRRSGGGRDRNLPDAPER